VLYSYISLLGIVGACSLRSRVLVLAGGAGQIVRFAPDPSELAEYILIFQIRGTGIGGQITYQLEAPAVTGVYDVTEDSFEIALGGSRDSGLQILFTNKAATPFNIEVDFARFNRGQLEDLRCLLGFPSEAAAALIRAQLAREGITAS
jgi:hypothetical protein